MKKSTEDQIDFEAAASNSKQILKMLRTFEHAVEVIDAARAATSVATALKKQIEAGNDEVVRLDKHLMELKATAAEAEQKHKSRMVAIDASHETKRAAIKERLAEAQAEFDTEKARLAASLQSETKEHTKRIEEMQANERKAQAALASVRRQVQDSKEKLGSVAL